MNNTKKVIILFFVFILIGSGFIFGDNILGLKGIVLSRNGVNYNHVWKFDADEVKKIKEFATTIEKKLKEWGYYSDDKSIKEVMSNLPEVVGILWMSAYNKIMDCESFGGHKDRFDKNFKDRLKSQSLAFRWRLGSAGMHKMENILLSEDGFYEILEYIKEKGTVF